MDCYDRDGKPITVIQWAELRSIPGYFRIRYTKLPHVEISTVWLGINHNYSFEPEAIPLIFESMVFPRTITGSRRSEDLGMDRYHTEEEAIAGHEALVAHWTNTPLRQEDCESDLSDTRTTEEYRRDERIRMNKIMEKLQERYDPPKDFLKTLEENDGEDWKSS